MNDIMLPLTPFLLIAAIRFIYNDSQFNFNIIDPTILSFAMAMLCYVFYEKISSLDNRTLRSINKVYVVFMILFVFFFALSIVQTLDIEISLNSLLLNIENPGLNFDINLLIQNFSEFRSSKIMRFDSIRTIVLILTVTAFLWTLFLRWKYKIGSDIYA